MNAGCGRARPAQSLDQGFVAFRSAASIPGSSSPLGALGLYQKDTGTAQKKKNDAHHLRNSVAVQGCLLHGQVCSSEKSGSRQLAIDSRILGD